MKDIHVEEINLTKNNHLFCSHETKSAKQFVATCYQNIALTAYRMKDFCLSIDACNEILSLEPLNVKALYRRAKATIAPKSAGTSKYLEALSDLKMALRLEPSSIEVRYEHSSPLIAFFLYKTSTQCYIPFFLIRRKYKQIKDLVRDQKAKDKATFQGFFERSRKAIYDYTRQGDVSVHGLEHESLDTILKHAESLFHKIKNDPNKKNDTLRLKEWIEQAHSRLSAREEKYAPQLNFKNPSQYEVDKASQFGIDLRDDRIIEMLEYLQSEQKRTSTDRTNQCIENSKLMVINYLQNHILCLFSWLYSKTDASKRNFLFHLLYLFKMIVIIIISFRGLYLILLLLNFLHKK